MRRRSSNGSSPLAAIHHVFDQMLALNRDQHTSLVLVTHDRRLARRLDRVLELHDGKLRELARDDV